MLNPSFPKIVHDSVESPYIAPSSIAQQSLMANELFDTGYEYRLQSVYGAEIWIKLERAGLTPQILSESSILEVCGGTGFLTYHLLSRSTPKKLTVNDISDSELLAAQNLIATHYPKAKIEWALGDMHKMDFKQTFDVIIGNSFIHHFHNVPQVLSRFASLLKPGGIFISLHEPTLMATVVESSKLSAYPLALLAPELVNNLARSRYKGQAHPTDLWLFEPEKIKQVALQSGFSSIDIYPWHFLRSLVVHRDKLHLSHKKSQLSPQEEKNLRKAIHMDARLNRILPSRFFGSICLICRVPG
jgi:ubiquinone/menaquinone biosynthesis C-methylase UbiE